MGLAERFGAAAGQGLVFGGGTPRSRFTPLAAQRSGPNGQPVNTFVGFGADEFVGLYAA